MAATTKIQQEECSLRTRDIIGIPCIGRQGLGTLQHFQQRAKAKLLTPRIRKKGAMIQAEARNMEDREKSKSCDAGNTRSIDKVGPPQKKNPFNQSMKA